MLPIKRAFGRVLSHRNVPSNNAISAHDDDCNDQAKKARLRQQPENIQYLSVGLNQTTLPFKKKQTTCALEAMRGVMDVDKENVMEISDEDEVIDLTGDQVEERVMMQEPAAPNSPLPPPPAMPQQEHVVTTPNHAAETPQGLYDTYI